MKYKLYDKVQLTDEAKVKFKDNKYINSTGVIVCFSRDKKCAHIVWNNGPLTKKRYSWNLIFLKIIASK